MRRYGAGEMKNIIPDAQQRVVAQGRIAMRRSVHRLGAGRGVLGANDDRLKESPDAILGVYGVK